jgi:hypothetical protein
MRKTLLVIALLLSALAPATAEADGFGITGGAAHLDDPPYRYVALSPHTRQPLTVVERIDLRDATIDRWWYLRGSYYLPAVAYDGTAGGLTADGKLVLSTLPRGFPPKRTGFAILDTRLFLSHPHRKPSSPRHAITRFSLPGAYSFDATSPDGSLIYLIHNFFDRRGQGRYGWLGRYEVRVLDTASRRLRPEPIVDPDEPGERMQGSPVSRVSSADGRWAYTLYTGGEETFLHALDTVRGRAVCVDLPQLEDLREPFQLRLGLSEGGEEILVSSQDTKDAPNSPLLRIDTDDFRVHEPLWMRLGLDGNFLQVLQVF